MKKSCASFMASALLLATTFSVAAAEHVHYDSRFAGQWTSAAESFIMQQASFAAQGRARTELFGTSATTSAAPGDAHGQVKNLPGFGAVDEVQYAGSVSIESETDTSMFYWLFESQNDRSSLMSDITRLHLLLAHVHCSC